MKKKRGKKDFSFKEQYKLSWDYLKESRKFIYIIIILFFLLALIGYFAPTPKVFEDQILKIIKELLMATKGMNQSQITSFLFLNNVQSSFIGFIFGFVFGLVPFLVSVFNGYLLGFVAKITVAAEGWIVLWKIIPHGIFELPAIWISLGLGLRLGNFLFEKKKAESFRKYLVEGLRVFIFVVIPLLVLAALIEGWLISVLS
jgi:stage II sporulation protein M